MKEIPKLKDSNFEFENYDPSYKVFEGRAGTMEQVIANRCIGWCHAIEVAHMYVGDPLKLASLLSEDRDVVIKFDDNTWFHYWGDHLSGSQDLTLEGY